MGDKHLDLVSPLIAETAFWVVAIHRRPLLIVLGHHYQPRRTDNPAYAGKWPTCRTSTRTMMRGVLGSWEPRDTARCAENLAYAY